MTHIIDGKEIAKNLRGELKKEISEFKNKYNAVPGLAVIQVGNVAASSVYVKAKTKSAHEVGIEVIWSSSRWINITRSTIRVN